MTIALAFAAVALLAPAARAAPAAGVKVGSCQTGPLMADRKATFTGHMHAVKGSSQLAMRFQLLEQYGDRRFARVPTADLRTWRKSRSGVQDYSYSQTVTGLLAGVSYRVQVQFRWLESNGAELARTKRTSGVCTESGDLPNLRVVDVSGRRGQVPGTEAYTIDLQNAGLAPATHLSLQLIVDGATPDTVAIDSLAAGEVRPIHFTGPVCRHRVRATADPSDAVREAVEADNSLSAPCPRQA